VEARRRRGVGTLVGSFFADAMLGKLARWLRILGYDTAYEKIIPDDELVERVMCEGRWLLTRDRYLAKRKVLRGRHTLIQSDHVPDQLCQLLVERRISLNMGDQTAGRCPECNLVLKAIPRETAARLVPPFVAAQHTQFAQCDQCAHVYWPGTQWDHLRAQAHILAERAKRAE
jgi:uncharacterized protein with PIN domain